MKRKEIVERTGFGSEHYSAEELTAEIGASFLKSHAGIPIEELENSAAYIKHWLEQLKNDKRFIVYASAQAQKAADYIMNIRHLEQEIEMLDEAKKNISADRGNEMSRVRKKRSEKEIDR